MLTWVQCMQSLLKAMNRDLQGLWIARLARDPLLVSGPLLPVWCVGARTRFLMTRCTIPTFVNDFAGNLFIHLIIYLSSDLGHGCKRDKMAALCVARWVRLKYSPQITSSKKEIVRNEADTPTSPSGKDTDICRRYHAN